MVPLAINAQSQQHKPKTDAELIANAMSAALASISHDATIIGMDGDKINAATGEERIHLCPG